MSAWRLWCELAWLGGHAAIPGVAIAVEGDRIVEVATGVEAAPGDATVLRGLTLPGIANAHSHAFHRALRGRTHADAGSFWTWRDRMYALAQRLEPDTYRALAAATFAEMVLAGFTCVGEFHYLHHRPDGSPYDDANAMGRIIIEAAAAAGIRLTLIDTCYLSGGFGAPPDATQMRFSDGDATRWAERVTALRTDTAGDPLVRIAAAIHSVRAVDPVAIAAVAGWATRHAAPLHAHVSEQPAENEGCEAAYGCSPTELLRRADALGARFTAVHATHLRADDVLALARSGSFVCMCPTTERDLADGIGPTAAFREKGVAVCLGTDSHALIDPFEEARAIELDERLSSLRRGTHRPHELLRTASSWGYASLGWPEGGRIEAGALADLTTVSLDSSRLAGATPSDALAAVLFAGAGSDVDRVMVGGEVVVRGGAHVRIDVAAALRDTIAAAWA